MVIPNVLYFILRCVVIIPKYSFIFSVESQVEFKGKEAYEIIRFHT